MSPEDHGVASGRDEIAWERDRHQLMRIKLAFGSLPDKHVIPVARRHGCSPATVRRRLAGDTARKGAFEMKEAYLVEICRLRNVKKGWRYLVEAGAISVSYHTFWRAWDRLSPARRAGVLKGIREMRPFQMYGKYPDSARNELWLGDSSMSNNYVWVSGFRKPRRPWHVFVMDRATRFTWMAVCDEAINAEAITATVAQAVVATEQPNGTVTGGIPRGFKMDLGRDYLAKSQQEVLARLETFAIPCDPYSPWQKGGIEAVGGTILEELCPGRPGFVRKYADGQPRPWHPDDGPLLTFDEYVRDAFDVLERYNNRPHSALDGKSPLEAWAASMAAIEWLPDESIEALARLFLRKSEERTVTKNGIPFRNELYMEPWLADHRGKRLKLGFAENVNLGVLGGTSRGIWVFEGDKYLGFVTLASERSPEAGAEIKRRRNREVATTKRIQRKAAQRRAELAAEANGRPQPADSPGKTKRRRKPQPRTDASRRRLLDGLKPRLTKDGDADVS